jgi:hypothetical protein
MSVEPFKMKVLSAMKEARLKAASEMKETRAKARAEKTDILQSHKSALMALGQFLSEEGRAAKMTGNFTKTKTHNEMILPIKNNVIVSQVKSLNDKTIVVDSVSIHLSDGKVKISFHPNERRLEEVFETEDEMRDKIKSIGDYLESAPKDIEIKG